MRPERRIGATHDARQLGQLHGMMAVGRASTLVMLLLASTVPGGLISVPT